MKNTKLSLNIIRKNKKELLKVLVSPYKDVFEAIMTPEVQKATKYISPDLIVRAVKKSYDNHANNRGNIELTVTLGKPNWAEREFIKRFGILKTVQLKYYSVKKKGKKRA